MQGFAAVDSSSTIGPGVGSLEAKVPVARVPKNTRPLVLKSTGGKIAAAIARSLEDTESVFVSQRLGAECFVSKHVGRDDRTPFECGR